MSRIPRTPEHFPRMKHRAAGRAIRKQRREADPNPLEVLVDAINAATARIAAFAASVGMALKEWQKAVLEATEVRPD